MPLGAGHALLKEPVAGTQPCRSGDMQIVGSEDGEMEYEGTGVNNGVTKTTWSYWTWTTRPYLTS
jgi:hypothetical protein